MEIPNEVANVDDGVRPRGSDQRVPQRTGVGGDRQAEPGQRVGPFMAVAKSARGAGAGARRRGGPVEFTDALVVGVPAAAAVRSSAS